MIGPVLCSGLFSFPHEGLSCPRQLCVVLELGLVGLQKIMLWSKELGWPCRMLHKSLRAHPGNSWEEDRSSPRETASSFLLISNNHLTCEL